MGRRRIACLVGVLAAFVLAAPAQAARVVTWTTTSRYVDPARVKFNSPPPDAAARPNALRVNVFLPDGYDGRRRFPVLFLLHGHGDAYDSWVNAKRGDLLNVARGFPGIIVMPEGATGWYVNWWNGGRRGEPAWERYHLEELVPLVERRLKVRRGRRWHAIAGLSMGGEGSMFYAAQRPGYFGSAASFSGVLSLQRPEWPTGFDTQGENHADVYGDPDAQRFYWTGHNPTALVENLRNTRLYVAAGDGAPQPSELGNALGAIAEGDLRMHAQDFVGAAHEAGDDVTYRPHSGIHDWPYWRADLADAIRWGFFGPVPERPARWTLKTVARTGDAWGLRFAFTAPPDAVETFRRYGRTLSATGSGTVRIRPRRGRAFTARLPFTRRLARGA